jgi:hypothetical protein
LILLVLTKQALLTQILLLHLLVALDHTGAVVECLIEARDVHKLSVVMDKHSGFVDLHEALPQSLHYLTRAGVVAEGQETVGLVKGRLVAVAHLEPLLVPAHHRQSLLQLLHVARDI